MPVTGRKPKPEADRRGRAKPIHDWIEVPNRPFDGEAPKPGRVPAATTRWWHAVSTMPHCILWQESDWQFALDTAVVHAMFVRKGLGWAATELRNREKILGTTVDARRDLRIRYVDDAPGDDDEGGPVNIDD